jgi:hypothetical protein
MSADFTGTFQPVYHVRLAPSEAPQLQWVPGDNSPVTLSLALRDHLSLRRALAEPPDDGAILVLGMRQEQVIEIYLAIRQLAMTMGWRLPPEDARLS